MAPRCDGTSGPPSYVPVPELDMPSDAAHEVTASEATARPDSEHDGAAIELAVDPRALVRERSTELPKPAADDSRGGPIDIACDAQLLADYGDPPGHLLLTPRYAYRVLKRRRELKNGLAGRREEAARAAEEIGDALVAFGERVRSTAQKVAVYSQVLEQLRSAEDLLRSRDQVLAAEQDAQRARLAQVDTRLSKIEAELADAQRAERAIADEMSRAQGALGREEARLKRADIELRAAQQRANAGEAGG